MTHVINIGINEQNRTLIAGGLNACWQIPTHCICKPTQNAFVESFNGKFRDNCLNQQWFRTINEARSLIETWRIDYNEIRPHSSLNYQPPSVFARAVA